MPIKVPIYEETIKPDLGQTAPPGQIPQPPAAAFGANEIAANRETSKIVGNLGNVLAEHVIERQKQDRTAEVLKADTAFRNDLQQMMFSPETDDKGVPKGVMNRRLEQAHGATVGFDQDANQLRQKYLSGFQSRFQQEALSKAIDSSITSGRESVIRHEANQSEENRKNVLDSNLKQRVTDASFINDPVAFKQALIQGKEILGSGLKSLGFDDNTAKSKADDFTKNMVESAVDPIIMRDPAAGQAFFDSIKSDLNPGLQTDLQKDIYTRVRQVEEMIKREKEKVYDANMRTAMIESFSGKLTLTELQRRFKDDTLKESDFKSLAHIVADPAFSFMRPDKLSDPSTFNDIRETQLTRSKTPGEIQRMIAGSVGAGKLSNNISQGKDADYLTNLTKELPPDPRDKDVVSQAKSVEDFGNRYFKQTFAGIEYAPGQKKRETADMVKDFYQRVDKEEAQGPRISEIANEVMAGFVKKRYPEVSRLEDIPHIVVDINGKVHQLLNPTQPTKLKPKYKLTPTFSAGESDQGKNQ